MSHTIVIELKIDDKDALIRAVDVLHLDWRAGQAHFRTYESVHGRARGQNCCDDAIGVPNNDKAYEIGVRRNSDGSYELAADFFNGGYGLEDIVGEDAWKLKQEYSTQVAINQYQMDGFTVNRQTLEDGRVQLECSR